MTNSFAGWKIRHKMAEIKTEIEEIFSELIRESHRKELTKAYIKATSHEIKNMIGRLEDFILLTVAKEKDKAAIKECFRKARSELQGNNIFLCSLQEQPYTQDAILLIGKKTILEILNELEASVNLILFPVTPRRRRL